MKIMKYAIVILCALLLLPTIAFAEVTDGNVGHKLTPGRLWATTDAVVGLISAILAGRALSRSTRRIGNGGRNGAIVAMVVGLIVSAYAVLHLNVFTGGFGTGAGRAGALIAILLGLTSMVLAGITLSRSRRTR